MSNQNKTEILAISTAAKSRIFEIESVALRFSNGEQRIYERLKPTSLAAVMVLAIDQQENLLLISEYAVGTEHYELGFPKGAMDWGETPEQSALRELQEEIGYTAEKLTLLRCVRTSPSYMNNPMYLFLAEDLQPSKLEGDEPEPLEIIRYPLKDLEKLLQRADFDEARNLTAVYMLRDYLRKRGGDNV